MLHLILAINLLVSSSSASYVGHKTLKTKEECEALIKKKYNSEGKKLYHTKHVITGVGNYATHFYYDIIFTAKTEKITKSCKARLYCTNYDYEIYEDQRICGK